jgi:leucyl aminopeptidase
MYNWKTVQIQNTDAEWRVVLADVLSYVEDKYNIENIFDFATLTGAAIIALGTEIIAVMWRNEKIIKNIQNVWFNIKEYAWELPLFKNYKKHIKAEFADIKNLWKWREAGTISAWLFLWEFVKNKNWVHFDIAWPNIRKSDPLYWTGWAWIGIRLAEKILSSL